MLMVVMTAEEQHDTADDHEAREYRFSVMPEYVLDAICLGSHKEGDAQQNIGG